MRRKYRLNNKAIDAILADEGQNADWLAGLLGITYQALYCRRYYAKWSREKTVKDMAQVLGASVEEITIQEPYKKEERP